MKLRTRSIIIAAALLLLVLLLIYNVLLSERISSDTEYSWEPHYSDPCYQFIHSLPPLTSTREFFELYLIDTDAIGKLKRNCSSSLDLPLSVMLSEDEGGIPIDTKTYSVIFYVDKGDYLLLKSTPERVLLKQDYHQVGPLFIPVDMNRFINFHQRSTLINCLNQTMHREDTETFLPANFKNKLAELRDGLIDIGTYPFLSGGTLLGWYRECSIIPHTKDADFGILRQEYRSHMYKQIKALPGFRVQSRMGRDYDSLELNLLALGGGRIDIFVVYDEDDKRTYISGLDFPSHRRYKWIHPKAQGYCSGILRGRLFFVPCNPEDILKAEYGSKWYIDHPTSSFDWETSSLNVVSNGVFTREEMQKYYVHAISLLDEDDLFLPQFFSSRGESSGRLRGFLSSQIKRRVVCYMNGMRLYRKWWRIFLLCCIGASIYLLRHTFLPEPVIKEDNSSQNITVTILGQDDGSRRKKSNGIKQKSSMTCNIPKLEINASEVVHFFHDTKMITCKKGRNWVYIDANRKAQLIEERKDAKCQVQRIFFKQDAQYYLEKIASYFTSERWEDLKLGEELPSEMVHVKCKEGNWFPDAWETPLLSLRKVQKEVKKSTKKRWNVFMLSFDSVSQLSFRRKLPKTVKFLEERLKTVVLNGYNIVADGTTGAFTPILTGATEEELPLTRKRFKTAAFVDDVFPFIWRNFSDAGYVTLFTEDQAGLGAFEYRLKGFRRPPTDHYARPYFKHLEDRLGTWNAQCVGSDLQHKHWLRYAREFAETYRSTPHFGLMHHCVYSHDDVNLIGMLDDELSAWLRSMSEEGLFDDTILIVMADHGARFADLRKTRQGQMEERLPFFSFTLPEALRATKEGAKMYENLKVNKDRLSSPFDIHQTLLDILKTPADFTKEQDASIRSLSLFRPIPSARSCEQAGIAPHWCTCLDWKDAMTTEEDKQISTEIADAIVHAFNWQLRDELKICSPLKLKGIEYAKKLIPKEDLVKFKDTKDSDGYVPDLSGNTKTTQAHYQIKLATSPGRGVYEVTVLFDFLTRYLTLDLSSVSHVSRYGNDPHCIISRNYFLATYCVCYDKI